MSAEAALNRWYDFLRRITEKHGALLEEARTGCPALHLEADLDPGPMTNAWTGFNAQALALESKVMSTWSEQVSDLFESSGVSRKVTNEEQARGEATAARMEWDRESTRLRIFGDAARRVWERAWKEMAQVTPCSQCGEQVPVPPHTYQAVNLTCPACDAVNTFEPGTWVRMIQWFCAHALAEENAFELWYPKVQAENARRGARSSSMKLIQAEEAATVAYWRRYLEVRAQVCPTYAPALLPDLKGKMDAFYRFLEYDDAWIRAGKPRMPLS